MTTELPTVEQMMKPFVDRLREIGVEGEITIRCCFSDEIPAHFTVFIGDALIDDAGLWPKWRDIESAVRRRLVINDIDLVALGM
jgi:hypothetical protein